MLHKDHGISGICDYDNYADNKQGNIVIFKKPIVNSDYKIITHEYDSGSRKQRNKSYMRIFLKRFHFT